MYALRYTQIVLASHEFLKFSAAFPVNVYTRSKENCRMACGNKERHGNLQCLFGRVSVVWAVEEK